ncbi:GNAT family N-acetyltransferase [Sediminibacterium soli]|uniref:GNAT family N-acetyltransferase n=1 Tax=Sediminibacterium soli TaxID=2698829 RepID=UPI00137B9089|nr:GNAT family protein [Sediminibacterium soli]NCI46990.1 GNAT family N-acetyltransferase [Sediminibacterium soli]
MIAFETSQDYTLEDDCVLLRPLQADDCVNLREFSINEPEIWRFSLLQAGGEENLTHYLSVALEAKHAGREYPFIVFDKRTQEYAGSTRFYDIQLPFKTLQLGYTWYGKRFQGTGLNRHCKFLLLRFAFEQLGMERVEFRADNNNARSIAAMKRIGCTVEGVLRSHMPTCQSDLRRDSIVLSILREEWYGHVRQKLIDQMNNCTR